MRLDETLRDALAAAVCPQCEATGGYAVVGRDWPHFGRVVCGVCDTWIDWLTKPQETTTERARRKRRHIEDFGDRCELCLRHGREVSLQIHHADEESDVEDLLRVYCSDCHQLVHWLRRTFQTA